MVTFTTPLRIFQPLYNELRLQSRLLPLPKLEPPRAKNPLANQRFQQSLISPLYLDPGLFPRKRVNYSHTKPSASPNSEGQRRRFDYTNATGVEFMTRNTRKFMESRHCITIYYNYIR